METEFKLEEIEELPSGEFAITRGGLRFIVWFGGDRRRSDRYPWEAEYTCRVVSVVDYEEIVAEAAHLRLPNEPFSETKQDALRFLEEFRKDVLAKGLIKEAPYTVYELVKERE